MNETFEFSHIWRAFQLLLRSRKFWLGVVAAVLPPVLMALGFGEDVATKVFELAVILITAITVEDAAEKLKG